MNKWSLADFPFYNETNVRSNVVSVRLVLQKLRLNVHWLLPVFLSNGNFANMKDYR